MPLLPGMLSDDRLILTESGFANPMDMAKQVTSHTADVLDPVINNTRMVQVVDTGVVENTFTASGFGDCDNADGNNYSALQPIYAVGGTDSYGLGLPGSLQALDMVRLMDTGPDPGNSVAMGTQGKAKKQPFASHLIEGPGERFTDYGVGPIPDPNHPGQALTSNTGGKADPKVSGVIASVRPERFKRSRLYPGDGLLFDPQIPPFDPPTIAQSVNNSANISLASGDQAVTQRRWGCTYSDGTHESEMGPLSDWAMGYLQADVTVPPVPADSAFSAITTINIYRNTAEDPDTFKLVHSFGAAGGTFTDTTADASLGAAYSVVETAIKVNRSTVGSGGGGGSGGYHGVRVYASTTGDSTHTGNWIGDNTTGTGCNVTDVTPMDTVDADGDPDGYWDATNHWITIPTGLGGRYLIIHKVKWNLIVDTGTSNKDWYVKLDEYGHTNLFEETGDADSNGSGTFTAGTNQGTAIYVREATFAEGAQIVPHVTFQAHWGMQSDAAEFTLIKLDNGSGATGHELRLVASSGDSGTTGNWLGDATGSAPLAQFTDAAVGNLTGVTAPTDTDSYFNSGTGTITIPTGLGGTYMVTMTCEWELQPASNSNTGFSLQMDPAVGDGLLIRHLGAASDDGFSFTSGTGRGTTTRSTIHTFADGATPQPLISMGGGWQVQGWVEYILVKLS